jgi:uncharacterized protein YbaR (Trm112 family)
MPYKVVCPDCHANLLIPDTAKSAQVSCPRCLAKMSVPRPGQASRPSEEPGLPVGGAPETLPCRHCGQPVLKSWRACPQCGKRLSRVAEVDHHDLPDRDAGRDESKTRIGLVILAILVVLGTIGVLMHRGVSTALPTLTGVFLLFFFAVAFGGVLLIGAGRRLSGDNMGCALMFIIVGTCLAVCGFALFMLTFLVCGSAPTKFH